MHSTPRQCPPWTLRTWPPLLWQLDRPGLLHLQHVGTQVSHPGNGDSPTVGQTIWAGHGDAGDIGMAWDWVQLAGGVVAMADPMAVVTNLRLVGDEGTMLTAYEAARHFNTIVHSLPWQQAVEQALAMPGLAERLVV